MTPWPERINTGIQLAFAEVGDPVRAARMKAYMRDQFEFLGIAAGPRKSICGQVLRSEGSPASAEQLHELARRCYQLTPREFHYAAVGVLRRKQILLTPESLPLVHELLVTHSWWDTVDEIAGHLLGGIVERHPDAVAVMDEWIRSDNLWVARAAILHQLRFREHTDEKRLFAYCDARAHERDFFYRKAIGWALRQYARIEPDAVRRYCADRSEVLSPLSFKEATKHL